MSKPVSYKLFKKASNGKLQEWTIEVDTQQGRFRTSDGYVGGAITTTAWTQCEGKNLGRANETSPESQALLEAKARITKQEKKGWTENVEEVDNAARKILPQLAKKFEDEIDKLIAKGCIIAAQPKLDGIRALGTKTQRITKEGGIHTITSEHLQEHIRKILDGTPDDIVALDGELYNHEFKNDFNRISSIVRKQNPNTTELAEARKYLEYHLYDINVPGHNFIQRYSALVTLFQMEPHPSFKVVDTTFFDRNEPNIREHLLAYHKKCVNEGYEGSMIRDAESVYESKRVRSLLKRKDWIDDEFKIVAIIEGKGNRAGWAASITCVDTRGEEFDAGVIGNEEYCRDLFKRKDKYIGEMATIKYQNLTPDRKVPRFGKMKTIL